MSRTYRHSLQLYYRLNGVGPTLLYENAPIDAFGPRLTWNSWGSYSAESFGDLQREYDAVNANRVIVMWMLQTPAVRFPRGTTISTLFIHTYSLRSNEIVHIAKCTNLTIARNERFSIEIPGGFRGESSRYHLLALDFHNDPTGFVGARTRA